MAEHQMSRWRGRLQRLDNSLSGPRRIARLFAAAFYGFPAVLAGRVLIVSDDIGRLLYGSPEIRPERAGRDDEDVDSQRFDLLRQRFRQARSEERRVKKEGRAR